MPHPIITLTTDFGRQDGYVAAMKGVILNVCPQATLVDVSHAIRPQAIRQAAYVLSTVTPYFPPGTVHLVVVDPGVGTERRLVAVQTARAIYVAPDNGVLGQALEPDPATLAVHLTEGRYRWPEVSSTFQGRDMLAPAAAYLACGTPPGEMGVELAPGDLLALPPLPAGPEAEVLHVDHFGNLITSLALPPGPRHLAVTLGGVRVEGLQRTYADVAPGQLLAYVGSSGYLEVGQRGGSAARVLGLDVGAPVLVEELP